MKLFCPAKLNLFLHIFKQREDGFHNLETFFQLIDLYDIINLTLLDNSAIKVKNSNKYIKGTDDICYKAAKLLQQKCNISKGVAIKVEKNIPIGAGLGGGSSNAACTLMGLNKLWNCNLSNLELQNIGLKLGSDVPIFIHNKSCLANSRGENFIKTPKEITDTFTGKTIVLLFPNINNNTKNIFNSDLLKKRNIKDYNLEKLGTNCIKEKFFSNDFEKNVFTNSPKILEAKRNLEQFSPTHLTGTGSCLYSVLDDNKKADRIVHSLESKYDLFMVKAIKTNIKNDK